MEVLRIIGATRTIGKSQGYIGLPVRDNIDTSAEMATMQEDLQTFDNGPDAGLEVPTMTTAWSPTPDELAKLAAGAPIYVRLVGTQHPPIKVFVGDPPE